MVPMPAAQAFALLEVGRIDSAWPMIALMWLHSNRERLRRTWSLHGDEGTSTGGAVGDD